MVGILATLAVPSFRDLASNQALSNAASDLLSASIQARSVALKGNRRTIVQPISDGNWRTGWRVYVDVNMNGTYETTVDTLILTREPLSPDITIVKILGSGDGKSVVLYGFDGDGFLANVNGNFNGSVVMRSAFTAREKIMSVSRVGRARICDEKQAPGCSP